MTKPRRGTKANPFEIGEMVHRTKKGVIEGEAATVIHSSYDDDNRVMWYRIEYPDGSVGQYSGGVLRSAETSNLKVLPAPPNENKRLAGLLREDADHIEEDRPIDSYALVAVYEDGAVGTIYDGKKLSLIGAVEFLRDRLVRDFDK